MKLETDSVLNILWYSIRAFYQLVSGEIISSTTSIDSLRTLVCEFCKIVSLKLHSVDLVVSAKLLDFLQTIFF